MVVEPAQNQVKIHLVTVQDPVVKKLDIYEKLVYTSPSSKL